MQLIRNLDSFQSPPSAVAIGNFDGLHRGHRAVIAQTKQAAAEARLVPSVLTFEPHPRRFFAPDAPEFRIEPLGMKLRRLREAGIAQVFMPRFNKAFAAMDAEQFLDEILAKRLNAKAVVTGENFAFGKGRRGDVAMLKAWGDKHFVAVYTAPAVMAEGDVCSSSAVRMALEHGDVTHAAALLGHPYQLRGRVVHGDGRGKSLGFATANIALPPGLKLPKNGIYAVRARVQSTLGDRTYDGVASLGLRPTIGPQEAPNLEVHLFDFGGDIYGATMETQFVGWLRAEEKFSSLAELTHQMAEDCAKARRALEGSA